MTKTLEKISNSSKDFFIDGGFKEYSNNHNLVNPINLELNKFVQSRSISNNIKSKFMNFYKDFFTKDPFVIYNKRDNSDLKNSLNSILLRQRKNKTESNNIEIKQKPKKETITSKKKLITHYLRNLKYHKEELNVNPSFNIHKNFFPGQYNKRTNSFRMMTNKVFGNGNTFLSRNDINSIHLLKTNWNHNKNDINLTQQNSSKNIDNIKLRLGLSSF